MRLGPDVYVQPRLQQLLQPFKRLDEMPSSEAQEAQMVSSATGVFFTASY